MANLHLVLTKAWFDMIASGDKKEEYRQDSKYWKRRLVKEGYWHSQTCKDFDTITFQHGYAKGAPRITVECLGISLCELSEVNKKWFGNMNDYQGCRIFIIKLGRIIP